jgi:hypothetical protein
MSEEAFVSVSVEVALGPAAAFAVFTAEVGTWYKQDRHTVVDVKRTKTLRFEPFVGGHFIAVYDLDSGEGHEMGRITVWEPGRRLVFIDGRDLEVDISFKPTPSGCRVTVTERGLDHLPEEIADHVRRYGWHATLPAWFAEHTAPVERTQRVGGAWQQSGSAGSGTEGRR